MRGKHFAFRSSFTLPPSSLASPYAVGAASDDDYDFAAELFGDAADLGVVGDEGAVGVRAAAHPRRRHRRLVVDINPRAALAPEAVARDRARLSRRVLAIRAVRRDLVGAPAALGRGRVLASTRGARVAVVARRGSESADIRGVV